MRTLLLTLACGAVPQAAEPPAPQPAQAASAEPVLPKYAATQVLVAFRGAAAAGAGVTRSEEEARALAEEVWRRASAGEPLEDLARETSDGPAAPRGGRLGVYVTGTMVPDFERAVAAVEVGGVTRPFRTPFGWHVVRRDPVVEAHLRHVLVAWNGTWRSGATRTREEARARIGQALGRITAGEDFAAVARELSDDPTAAAGGDLGVVAPGQLVPAFEEAAFALEPGERSGVVETPYGFHVVERLE